MKFFKIHHFIIAAIVIALCGAYFLSGGNDASEVDKKPVGGDSSRLTPATKLAIDSLGPTVSSFGHSKDVAPDVDGPVAQNNASKELINLGSPIDPQGEPDQTNGSTVLINIGDYHDPLGEPNQKNASDILVNIEEDIEVDGTERVDSDGREPVNIGENVDPEHL